MLCKVQARRGTNDFLNPTRLGYFKFEISCAHSALHSAATCQPQLHWLARIGFLEEDGHGQGAIENRGGASFLNISRAPASNEFEEWWRRQLHNARRDGVVIVVVKRLRGSCQRKWLEQIEEEEWENDEEGDGRVRFTTIQKLNIAYLSGSLLTDDWGDSVEKGDLARKENDVDLTDEGVPAAWFLERVCVQLKKNNAQAVIKQANGSNGVVEMEDKSRLNVRNEEVSRVPPQEHDMVLVTGGADVGVEGELICIDGADAIVKESNENFRMVDFVHLAKIASE